MSGAEIIGLISGIIGILDAAIKVYSTATDASGLPEAFRTVVQRLPLVKETLQTALKHLNASSSNEELYKAIKPIVDGCADKAARLEVIFRKVIPEVDSSRIERYFFAVKTLGKGNKVESLMKGILEDLQLLVGNRVMKLATKTELGTLVEATKEVEAIPPSLQNERSISSINNYGSGPQNVHTGSGPQNNNNGPGQQFIGSTFHGVNPFLRQ
ncbi:hypothetical protein FOBRF1_006800 [Fusarium oxysporum]